MRTYCSLVISSEVDAHLGRTVKRVLGLSGGEVVDTQTPELVARRERLAKMMGSQPSVPPRYFWRLSSKDAIESFDAQTHIAWLLDQMAPGRSFAEIAKHGCSAYLTCFWAGSGRGGGPVLPASLLRVLADHGVELQFDFYVEEDEGGLGGGPVH